jgi:hypothetical protein
MYLEREEIRAACNQPISCVVVDASGHCVEDVPPGYQMEVGCCQGGRGGGGWRERAALGPVLQEGLPVLVGGGMLCQAEVWCGVKVPAHFRDADSRSRCDVKDSAGVSCALLVSDIVCLGQNCQGYTAALPPTPHTPTHTSGMYVLPPPSPYPPIPPPPAHTPQ